MTAFEVFADRAARWFTASTIRGKRAAQSWPLRVSSRMPTVVIAATRLAAPWPVTKFIARRASARLSAAAVGGLVTLVLFA
jgi:hypothetical protein